MSGYTFFTDPGHGWLRVQLDELDGFEPSAYSYLDDTYAYLEEDCDVLGWLDHHGVNSSAFWNGDYWANLRTVHADGDSFIRSLASFPGKASA